MTEQQTAATDNALVEKLGAWNIHKFGGDETHRELRNPDGPEAAERIKSLQAEVERLNAECEQRISAYMIAHDQAMSNGEAFANAEADRQRMREALEFAAYHWTDKPTPTKLEAAEQTLKDIKLVSLAALKHASKEANDG